MTKILELWDQAHHFTVQACRSFRLPWKNSREAKAISLHLSLSLSLSLSHLFLTIQVLSYLPHTTCSLTSRSWVARFLPRADMQFPCISACFFMRNVFFLPLSSSHRLSGYSVRICGKRHTVFDQKLDVIFFCMKLISFVWSNNRTYWQRFQNGQWFLSSITN